MLDRLFSPLQFQSEALTLRAQRQSVLASNIANVDTPNYKARDFDFGSALARATGQPTNGTPAGSSATGTTTAVTPTVSKAISTALPAGSTLALAATSAGHLGGNAAGTQTYSSNDATLAYRKPDQASLDGNTVELDRERGTFADNAIRYEAALKFINGNVKNLTSAIKGE